MTKAPASRNYGLDILRVIACYMVIQAHAGEFYYIGNGGKITNTVDAYWVGWYNPICIISVPLFIMISGLFLFPVTDVSAFFKKRFSRILIPFVIWCVFYALYYYLRGYADLATTLTNISNIPLNYGAHIGHLWFVYMLLGIYLFAPIISPWIQTASRKSMEFYLVLWAVTLTVPYIHLLVPEIWGETFWNRTPMLYYFSGFLGYVVMANYIKRYHMEPRRWNYIAGIALLIAGYAITTYGFIYRLPTEKFISKLALTWGFETINVAMMTAGAFLMFKNIKIKNPDSAFMRLMIDIAAKSYGIYLAHILILNAVHSFFDHRLGSAALKIPVMGVCTFIATFIVVKLLSFLPKSKWIVG
ncbi:acyltransferase [Mucilaginibacter sp.]|uniref:acyltransferase n=1 Tax=Mucilaginibacter sp. TaxID=1882438 RepID=UPI003D1311B8